MAAAITASDNGGNVTIFEHMPRMGKKLLMTGSGKCNISNEDMDLSHFHSADTDLKLVKSVFSNVSPAKMIDFFAGIGLLTKSRNGYIYPYCEQASAVLDVLRFAVRERNITVCTECNISEIKVRKDGFVFDIENSRNASFDRVIIATGSCAYKSTGSDGSGFKLCTSLGHHIIKPLPALTFLTSDDKFIVSLAGIRTRAKVTVCGKSEIGELQLTRNGISGIPVFNLSYLASKALDEGKKVKAEIDFLPESSEESLKNDLTERCMKLSERPVEELLIGILHKNLGNTILKECGLKNKMTQKSSSISAKEISDIADKIKHFPVCVKSTGGFDNAQVCCGGVDTKEVSENLESLIAPNLFFAGEILDVNGDCGGYNLSWAFCSGILAANEAMGVI